MHDVHTEADVQVAQFETPEHDEHITEPIGKQYPTSHKVHVQTFATTKELAGTQPVNKH